MTPGSSHHRKTRFFVAVLLNVVLALLIAVTQRAPAAAYDVCDPVGKACVHEYMADEAKAILPNGPVKTEIETHWAEIKGGINHEDGFDHVYGLNLNLVLIGKPLVTATHFWDADTGPETQTHNADEYGLGDFQNSWQKVRALWVLALGAYADGNTERAYHYLGHIVHHIEDNTVPAHVHDDAHPNLFPDITGGLDDDSYHVWMDDPGSDANAPKNAKLTNEEKDYVRTLGPLGPQVVDANQLHYLLYSTNQIADHFASDDVAGDNDDPLGYMAAELAALPNRPTTREQLEDNDGCLSPTPVCPLENNNRDGDLALIRQFSYLRGIRAVASLYQLFEQATKTQISLVVVIDKVEADQNHEGLDEECVEEFGVEICDPFGDSPDFSARVSVAGYEARNRGDRIDEHETIEPHWVFANSVPTAGSASVQISIWDHDGLYDDPATGRGGDDQSDIDSTGGDGDPSLDLTVDLAKCLRREPGAVTGDDISIACGQQWSQAGDAREHESKVTFRIFMSKSPPIAHAGGPYTTKEGTDVKLDGTGSTDPDNDITSYAWDLDGDGACDDIANDSKPDFTAVGQDGVTTVKLCVTDAVGLTSEASTTVTVTNETPVISLSTDSPKDENTTLTVSGTVTDPGWLDNLSATISWGDGSAAQPIVGTLENARPNATLTVSVPHVYGDNGTFTVQVCAADDDTNPCATVSVQIGNTPPTAAIDMSGAVSVNGTPTIIAKAGQSVPFSGRSTDPGSDDLTLSWDWGDGTSSSRMFLVNDPVLDPFPSPSIQPRDVTFAQAHAFAQACAYTTSFGAIDDDGGSRSQTAAVIIVGNSSTPRLAGYWKQQFQHYNSGKRPLPDFTSKTLGCYIKIVGYMSLVFDERNDASTLLSSEDILDTSSTSVILELFDQQLLAVWLNFANGAVTWDQLVDTDGDKRLDTRFLDAVAAAESLRLDRNATRAQLERQKTILERWTGAK